MKNLVSIFLCIILLGCNTELYTGLSQKEGNEMLSVLLSSGIDSKKEINSDGFVSIIIDDSDVSEALNILRNKGYPKEKFTSLNQVFPDEGLISSPVAERAKLLYVTSQEIASTLSQIDGVITARVHIVTPSDNGKGRLKDKSEVAASSASVFIKHFSNVDVQGLIPKIKLLVHNSVENLQYERITVILVPANDLSKLSQCPEVSEIFFVKVIAESKTTMIIGVFFFLLVIIFSNLFIYLYLRNNE